MLRTRLPLQRKEIVEEMRRWTFPQDPIEPVLSPEPCSGVLSALHPDSDKSACVFDVWSIWNEGQSSGAVHTLLAGLQKNTLEQTRFHLIGHPLGAHRERKPKRKLHSLTLLQGAMPIESFAKGHASRLLAEELKSVAGPIIVTKYDRDNTLFVS